MKVCSVPGCPILDPSGKCAKHRAEAERARGTRQQRGYDSAHDTERARWLPIVNAGGVDCARCGRPIGAGSPFDLGHTDDRRAWTGPEHPACNRAAGGKAAHRD